MGGSPDSRSDQAENSCNSRWCGMVACLRMDRTSLETDQPLELVMTGDGSGSQLNSMNHHLLLPARTLCPPLDNPVKIVTSVSGPSCWQGPSS